LVERDLLITKHYFLSSSDLFPVKNNEKLGGSRFYQKTQLFQNVRNFPLCPFFQLPKVFFSDSASSTDYKQVVKLTLAPNTFW
jgi:hypothetical protein